MVAARTRKTISHRGRVAIVREEGQVSQPANLNRNVVGAAHLHFVAGTGAIFCRWPKITANTQEAPLSLTAHEVDRYFQKAKRDGLVSINPVCDCCGRHGCGAYAAAYRARELSMGHFDPGNICASCAAVHERVVGRIISEAAQRDH